MEPPFILVQHPDEKWWPVGVEEAIFATKPSLPQSFPLPLQYGYHREQSGPNRINFPPRMVQPDLPPVFYHELLHERGMDYHRWWTFYLYNPGPPMLEGKGRHEVDWECIQITYTLSGEPQSVVLSQHHGGGLRFWWTCEPRDNKIVIYDALGSHAKYYTPGVHIEGPDVCGHGREIAQAEVRELNEQPWRQWDGLWGNSTGVGKSPVSPGRQRRSAHLFLSSAHI